MLPSQDYATFKEKPTIPQRHRLHSGDLRCIYENGFIRYISADNTELIRNIYPALRDQSWRTVPAKISSESIEQLSDEFHIRYQADYALDDIRYTAQVSISCVGGKNLTVSFSGKAGSDFLRNRIGLCALLPPEKLRGGSCETGHSSGSGRKQIFPDRIQPEQPFLDLTSLDWQVSGRRIRMEFSGDIFEAEDQRNWGDASYKIYSTPHDLPLPFKVRTGDIVRQEIRIVFESADSAAATPKADYVPVIFHTGKTSTPFPAIGYCYNPDGQTPTADSIRLLRRLGIDHYRVEIFLSHNWKNNWAAELETATRLGTKMLVVVYHNPAEDNSRLDELLAEIKKTPGMLSGLLLFSEQDPLTSRLPDERFSAAIARDLPHIPAGSGTDTFFAHWNQQPIIPADPGDFVAVPVSPQVHQTDDLTIVENLAAMTDIIETIRYHSHSQVFIGPVTLKPRYNPDARNEAGKPVRFPYAVDARQSSLFAARWTAAALRYLCGADKLSLFELTGDRGLLPDHSPEPGLAAIRVFPVYLLLRELAAFRPKNILLSRSLRPGEVDGVVMENARGDRLMIFCNFTGIRQTLQLKMETWKTLPWYGKTMSPDVVAHFQEDGEKFRSTPYEPVTLSESNSYRIAAGSILFMTSLPDWSFS